jgi:hypothetical protein
MFTANLGVPYVVAAQSQPEVTVNGAFDDFDGALGSKLAHTMTDADYTLNLSAIPNEALAYYAYDFTASVPLTADRNIVIPTNKKTYAVWNNTTAAKNLIVKTSGGTGVTVSYSATAAYTLIYCDGTNVVPVGSSTGGGSSITLKTNGTTNSDQTKLDIQQGTNITVSNFLGVTTINASGATISWQGAYNAGTTYALNDGVSYSGSSYISLISSNTGNQPDTHPADWGLIAQKGAAGGGGPFTGLSDVPVSYTGQAGKVVTVKGTEDGLQFSTAGGGGGVPSGSPVHDFYFNDAPAVGVGPLGTGYTIVMKISGRSLKCLPTSWKVRIMRGTGSHFGAIVILRTLLDSLAVVDSTPVSFSGSLTPTLTGFSVSDAIALPMDVNHDYYVYGYNDSGDSSFWGYKTAGTPGQSTGPQYIGAYLSDHSDSTGVTTIATGSWASGFGCPWDLSITA